MSKGFTVPAQLTRASALADGSLSIGFHTKELTPEEKVAIMKFFHGEGWLLFRENKVDERDIPAQDAAMEGKTPSQRLRAVLFIWWKQLGEDGDFEVFYRDRMEALINHVKSKLDQ